jgi:DNA-directed RNA polymerase specialized sigma24 family protein
MRERDNIIRSLVHVAAHKRAMDATYRELIEEADAAGISYVEIAEAVGSTEEAILQLLTRIDSASSQSLVDALDVGAHKQRQSTKQAP